ncbi:MAG: hypothetical protein V4501_09735 [Pseudomonadota bacterium]
MIKKIIIVASIIFGVSAAYAKLSDSANEEIIKFKMHYPSVHGKII